MASMTKLRRRFLRWDRYLAKVHSHVSHEEWNDRSKSGYWRSLRAFKEEQMRREVRTVYWPTVEALPIDRRLL